MFRRDGRAGAGTSDPGARTTTAARPASPQVRVGVKALASTSTRVLLVKERHADGEPFWTLPGGGVDGTESLRAGLQRELAEELYCRAVVGDAVTTFWYTHRGRENTYSVYTVFTCKFLSAPTPNQREGIVECRWVEPTDPPAATLPQVRDVLHDLKVSDRSRQ